jgi:hypothetical protein
MEDAAYFLEKAAQCRRLAASITDDAARGRVDQTR